MIQEAVATLKARLEVLELSRVQKAINSEERQRNGALVDHSRVLGVRREPQRMHRDPGNKNVVKMSPPRTLGPILIAFLCFCVPEFVAAQSTAGPLPPAHSSDEPVASAPVAKPRSAALLGDKPNLSGTWNLNKDQSDDPQQLIDQASKTAANNPGTRSHVSLGGGGWGGMGGTGGAGPRIGNGGGQGRSQDREGQDMTDELSQITIEQTASTAKIVSSFGDVLGVYPSGGPRESNGATKTSGNTSSDTSNTTTGGSTLAPSNTSSSNSSSNPSGNSTAGAANSSSSGGSNRSSGGEGANATPIAKWKDTQLIVVTSGQRGGTITRTYELSSDSQQLNVTTVMDNPRFKHPVTIIFVYDPAPSGG
jgi:hypothetical protein